MNIWTIYGRQFDMRKFIEKHPGGKEAINLGRGRDCTYLVESYHPHSDKVWNILKKYEVNKKQGIDEENWPPQDPFYNDIKHSYKYVNQTNYIALPSPASIGTMQPVIIDADREVRNSIRE